MSRPRFCCCLIAALALTSVPGAARQLSVHRGTSSPGPSDTLAWGDPVPPRRSRGSLAAARSLLPQSGSQAPSRRELQRVGETLRAEGQAVLAIADAAAAGDAAPADFPVDWHHDFLKAQAGTFVPFIVTIRSRELHVRAVLLYVRLTPREGGRLREDTGGGPTGPSRPPDGVVEEIYPVELPDGDDPARIARGLSAAPGDYDLILVVRERVRPGARGRRQAAVLRRVVHVPDLGGLQLTTSSIMLADQLVPLSTAPRQEALLTRPYAIGTHEVQRRLTRVFGRHEELIVVFLVYNPTLTSEEHFDLEVEYHFFQTERPPPLAEEEGGARPPSADPGERYWNRTEPQRFNPLVVGPRFEPAAGGPLLAGQRVPLAGFSAGDYRLAITVTDLVAGRTIARQVYFSVRS